MSEEIKVGDVVSIKSTSELFFTVSEIEKGKENAKCWFLKDGKPVHEWLPVNILEVFNS